MSEKILNLNFGHVKFMMLIRHSNENVTQIAGYRGTNSSGLVLAKNKNLRIISERVGYKFIGLGDFT